MYQGGKLQQIRRPEQGATRRDENGRIRRDHIGPRSRKRH